MNDVLREMLEKFFFVYLDDILLFSKSHTEHVRNVRQVLRCLLDAHLLVKAEKCVFHTTSVSFLGFIVAKGNVRMDPKKVSAVSDWPTHCFLTSVYFANSVSLQPPSLLSLE